MKVIIYFDFSKKVAFRILGLKRILTAEIPRVVMQEEDLIGERLESACLALYT